MYSVFILCSYNVLSFVVSPGVQNNLEKNISHSPPPEASFFAEGLRGLLGLTEDDEARVSRCFTPGADSGNMFIDVACPKSSFSANIH